ncbi:MAG TPA: TlpA disulfide reductase family protein [Luteimonas sp.]|nr:TlpA disulfide reductase family protein [Luteimonas sp.]
MKPGTGTVLLVALAAGALGVVASLLGTGPGPLLQTELGQRVLNTALSVSAPKPPAGVTVAHRGELLPMLVLPGLDRKPVTLPAAYAGRPLLINVWASWCGPCIKEMPELQRFAAQQPANGVQVVGIALDDAAAVRAFLQRVPVSYPILLGTPGPADAGVRLGNPKGVLPYSVLVSTDGRLLKQRIGPFADGEIDRWSID